MLTTSGVAPDPDKVSAVCNWPKPETNKELVQFLSFANYLRGYVRHFSEIAGPLDKMRGRYNKTTKLINHVITSNSQTSIITRIELIKCIEYKKMY